MSRLPVAVYPKQLIIGLEGNGKGVGAIRENLRSPRFSLCLLLASPDPAGLRFPRRWLTPLLFPNNVRPVWSPALKTSRYHCAIQNISVVAMVIHLDTITIATVFLRAGEEVAQQGSRWRHMKDTDCAYKQPRSGGSVRAGPPLASLDIDTIFSLCKYVTQICMYVQERQNILSYDPLTHLSLQFDVKQTWKERSRVRY